MNRFALFKMVFSAISAVLMECAVALAAAAFLCLASRAAHDKRLSGALFLLAAGAFSWSVFCDFLPKTIASVQQALRS